MDQFSLFLFIHWVLIIIIIIKFFVDCQHLIFHFTDLIISVSFYGPDYFYRSPNPPLYQNAYMQICLLVVYTVLGTWALLYLACVPGGVFGWSDVTASSTEHGQTDNTAGYCHVQVKAGYTGLNNLIFVFWASSPSLETWARGEWSHYELRGFLLSSLL